MNEPKIPGGAIVIARKIIDSEIMDKPPLYMKVWVYLLGRAQHKQYKQLKRGQLKTSIPEIQEACSWHVGARKVTPTIKEVRCVLDWMRGKSPRKSVEGRSNGITNGTMISTTKGTHGMLVTIDNYDLYQDLKNYEGHKENDDERHDEKSSKGTTRAQYKQECFKNDNKKNRPKYDDDSTYMKMAQYMLQKIQEWNEGYTVKNMQKWADDFRKIVELDEKDKHLVKQLIDWATSHSFWQSNVLSPEKLRKQFSTLNAQMISQGKKNNVTPFRGKQQSEPVRVNMPSLTDEQRQQIVEEQMQKVKEEKQRKRKEAELNGTGTSI